jgi:hypothetical protein
MSKLNRREIEYFSKNADIIPKKEKIKKKKKDIYKGTTDNGPK